MPFTLRFDLIFLCNRFLQIASVQTDFQTIDIYDVFTPERGTLESYEKSLANNGSYESTHPELFQPDRIIFLGGILQSRRVGDAAYHEALVHPSLFAHPNPKRVAIIGGGEGATLREVLKHKTVEKVVMIEIDEMMVNVSRRFLPDWSDCSNIVGSSDNCFDDARVELYLEDAFKWFEDRFLAGDNAPEDAFDVIIMDAL
jgi:spermidine synthase